MGFFTKHQKHNGRKLYEIAFDNYFLSIVEFLNEPLMVEFEDLVNKTENNKIIKLKQVFFMNDIKKLYYFLYETLVFNHIQFQSLKHKENFYKYLYKELINDITRNLKNPKNGIVSKKDTILVKLKQIIDTSLFKSIRENDVYFPIFCEFEEELRIACEKSIWWMDIDDGAKETILEGYGFFCAGMVSDLRCHNNEIYSNRLKILIKPEKPELFQEAKHILTKMVTISLDTIIPLNAITNDS